MQTSEILPFANLHGLRPRCWICVGAGYSREDVKSLVLGQAKGFVGDAVINLQEIAIKIVSAGQDNLTAERVLGPLARQEVLRMLLAETRISSHMIELKRLRRQRTFFRKLDRAMQSGRMAFAHDEELAVLCERLEVRVGPSPIRDELKNLAQAYETWLTASRLWDEPLLLRAAVEILEQGWPAELTAPDEILFLSTQTPDSLETALLEALGQHVRVERKGPSLRNDTPTTTWTWERWHTLDDAADTLADRLSADQNWNQQWILLPDIPGVRRSLGRALAERGIPLADSRDPTRLRWEETVKWALLPIEIVARNYERQSVVSWLRTWFFEADFSKWVSEINARGIRQGLNSYTSGTLTVVHARLLEIGATLGGRKTCAELGEAHLKLLRESIGTQQDRLWLVAFFESLWKEFVADTALVEQDGRRAPTLFWFERLQSRVEQASPPVEFLKASSGVKLYRLQQALLESATLHDQNLYIFGMPATWLSGDGAGDYWFSEREREVLSGEFGTRSAIQVRAERIAVLKDWISSAGKVSVLDSLYDFDGRERGSILPILRELGQQFEEPLEHGSHPRWSASYGALRPVQPQNVQLPSMATRGISEISATVVDNYSRCGFWGLGGGRWKLWDCREPQAELWPDVRGNILHAAVLLLMGSRDPQGNFKMSCEVALESAWHRERPKGLLKGPRLQAYAKKRLIATLETFCAKEKEYFDRSGTQVLSMEEQEPLRMTLRTEQGDVVIVGRPDRIDQHTDGLFVIDYKTSSSLPNGTEMVELGYRLQLPFYALATQRKYEKPVLGVQFVELNRKGGRTRGIFLKNYNGKEPGNLTNTRARTSLFDADPTVIWSKAEAQLMHHVQGYMGGTFEARPKKPQECPRCSFRDLCGHRRKSPEELETTEGGGE